MNPQDPLAQLKDIHLPDPVGWWPLAWGWWVLIALALAGLLLLLWRWRARRRRLRYRREAQTVLRWTYHRYTDSDATTATRDYLQALSELLRRTALSALPERHHAELAALNGRQWLRFLDSTAPVNNGFSDGPGQALAEGPYQPNPSADVDALNALAERWLKHHKLNTSRLPMQLEEARHA